mmetsp:Transcript_27071/g.45726  ORF Transcript_27071/g.45726 Transcript_27071/m.45726 type:complete len:201 (-) Transcript_27071:124-726(-)
MISSEAVGSTDLCREDGEKLGLDVEGIPDGARVFPPVSVGLLVVFIAVGATVLGVKEGDKVGSAVVGLGVGAVAGLRVTAVGTRDGDGVYFSSTVGTELGTAGVGDCVGRGVGESVGCEDGANVEPLDGSNEGIGSGLGSPEGKSVPLHTAAMLNRCCALHTPPTTLNSRCSIAPASFTPQNDQVILAASGSQRPIDRNV